MIFLRLFRRRPRALLDLPLYLRVWAVNIARASR